MKEKRGVWLDFILVSAGSSRLGYLRASKDLKTAPFRIHVQYLDLVTARSVTCSSTWCNLE